MKERFRKFLVALKRKPHMIPLVVLGLAFLIYSLRLTVISNTTAKIQGQGMGLCGFIAMLFSMLGLVSFGRSFPHRKPVNKYMLALMFILHAAVIYADIRYMGAVRNAIYREVDPIAVTASTAYITESLSLLRVHIIVICAGLGLTALLPVYAPMIKKINTSINIEGNGEMETIDISGEDA
ncbi:MAG: hypothetical protein IJ246_04145 [Clostridia bacterium]|nr:hypothetical protein [Clostridia bacterium]